jgi:hypothetical protein
VNEKAFLLLKMNQNFPINLADLDEEAYEALVSLCFFFDLELNIFLLRK